MTIGRRIDRIITEKGLRYGTVAQALGITVQYLKLIREDKAENVSITFYKAFCYEYQIHYDYLISGRKTANISCTASDTCKEACKLCKDMLPEEQERILRMVRALQEPPKVIVPKSLRGRK